MQVYKSEKKKTIPFFIECQLKEKRQAQQKLQQFCYSQEEKFLNSLTKEVKLLLITERNREAHNYLVELVNTAATDYSFWKSTKSLKGLTQQNLPIIKPDSAWAKMNAEKWTLC